ncbi:FAD/NAD(P)-binding domain-containing protein [Heliocybe sulcata]|uniref:FAD/NAD(P)-binding domain-containing protein n=1 Tax=Heliocybe sulcata TaxID=5364 RepID=A0A5C3MW37_9AGAM|nr:FAD/NAD(P)-binding domain-containing protein [Heliocybe sulcata]
MSETPPILIAGAGPVGLVLALCLRQNGVPVRIIDKDLTHHVRARASGIMPRTLEIYNFLGILSDVMKASRPAPTLCNYELPGGTKVASTFPMFVYNEPRPDRPYLNVRTLAQNITMSILRSYLAKLDCEVELGTALDSFEDRGDHILAKLVRKASDGTEVTESYTASYLVGADGSHSIVRKRLNIAFDGEPFEQMNMLFADVRIRGIENTHWNKWGELADCMVTIRKTENEDSYWLLAGGGNFDPTSVRGEPEYLTEWIGKMTGRDDIKVVAVQTFANYKPQMRMVQQFSKGRVYLAGDAAHVHSPAGGQGMNNGVGDAYALAWRLSLAYRNLASEGLLSSYTEERAPIIKGMLERTTALLKKASIEWGSFGTLANEDPKRKHKLPLYQLDLHYRWSRVVSEETSYTRRAIGDEDEDDLVRAGDRAPDAPGLVDLSPTESSMKTLFQYFKPTHHTALIFSSSETAIEAFVSALAVVPANVVRSVVILPGDTVVRADNIDSDFAWRSRVDHVLKDCGTHAYKIYAVDLSKGDAAIIVRPDGMVGAIVEGADSIKRYFRNILRV